MDPTPPEQLAFQCAVLSGALQGRTATFEAVRPSGDDALIAAHTLFDGLRIEGAPGEARLLVLGGGRVLWEGEGPIALSREGETLVVERAGAPAARLVFAPEGHPRPARAPLRERTVGDATA
ncbi:MAG TPA: hypothetical protein PKD53_28300 [Chloroflexaceae bacterium]|nr:hypothetical protein [Chloroflexaceae bacterium]